MAKGARVNVAGTATLIAGKAASSVSATNETVTGALASVGGEGEYYIKNTSGAAIDVGGPTVGAGTGYELVDDEVLHIHLGPGEGLYGIGPDGTNEVMVLRVDG